MGMRVSEVLTVDTIIVRPPWTTFDDAVDGLVKQLVTARCLPPDLSAEAGRHVREREAVASTAMVNIGVSIPHARLDGIRGIIAALAVSPRAVYQVADGLPIPLVALVLSSPALTGEHLNFLSALSLLLQSARTGDRLRNASTAAEVLEIISRSEQARR